MKKYSLILWAVLSLPVFTSCNEETVEPFSAETGINFLEPTGTPDAWTNGYTNLFYQLDFSTVYAAGNYGQDAGEFTLRVALEGPVSDTPHKVNFQVEPVEGYDTPVITVPSEATEIAAGEYTADAVFAYQKPAKYDTEYRAYIVFDYAQSDVAPGTKERQKFLIVLKNTFDLSVMYVESREEWNEHYEAVLGPYGEEKVRFLTSAFANIGARLGNAAYYTYYDYYAEYYGLQRYLPGVIAALNEYNEAHPDAPVREADGTLVTFPEP